MVFQALLQTYKMNPIRPEGISLEAQMMLQKEKEFVYTPTFKIAIVPWVRGAADGMCPCLGLLSLEWRKEEKRAKSLAAPEER